ncbi:hypothetical protein Pelo_2685 [Pelomyxa schiedti]|nr:hypothetical protein Pelo_2685 [Pelomyxa schiedti]
MSSHHSHEPTTTPIDTRSRTRDRESHNSHTAATASSSAKSDTHVTAAHSASSASHHGHAPSHNSHQAANQQHRQPPQQQQQSTPQSEVRYKRLLDLKGKHKELQQELSSLSKKLPKRRKTVSDNSNKTLRHVITRAIEAHGGQCHFETLVYLAKENTQQAQKNTLSKKPSDDPTSTAPIDTRTVLKSILTGQKSLFTPAPDDSEMWMMVESDDSGPTYDSRSTKNKQESLYSVIVRAMQSCAVFGSAHFDDILDFVTENWNHPQDMTDILPQNIRVTLYTHPSFAQDPSNPDFWILTKQIVIEPVLDDNSPGDSVAEVPRAARKAKPTQKVAPSVGSVCSNCGNPTGKGPITRGKANEKETLCSQCLSPSKKHCCLICHKPYKLGRQEREEWIQCDDCCGWIMVKCDSAIEDLSRYDDNNPNHLHYSCPLCRNKTNSTGAPKQDSLQRSTTDNAASAAALEQQYKQMDERMMGADDDSDRENYQICTPPQIQPNHYTKDTPLSAVNPQQSSGSYKAIHSDITATLEQVFAEMSRECGFHPPGGLYDDFKAITSTMSLRLSSVLAKQEVENEGRIALLNQALATTRTRLVAESTSQLKEMFMQAVKTGSSPLTSYMNAPPLTHHRTPQQLPVPQTTTQPPPQPQTQTQTQAQTQPQPQPQPQSPTAGTNSTGSKPPEVQLQLQQPQQSQPQSQIQQQPQIQPQTRQPQPDLATTQQIQTQSQPQQITNPKDLVTSSVTDTTNAAQAHTTDAQSEMKVQPEQPKPTANEPTPNSSTVTQPQESTTVAVESADTEIVPMSDITTSSSTETHKPEPTVPVTLGS